MLVIAGALAPARETGRLSPSRREAVETLSSGSFASVPARDTTPSAPNGAAQVPRATVPAASTAPAVVPSDVASPRPTDCTPPYYFDPAGIKHVKEGCG